MKCIRLLLVCAVLIATAGTAAASGPQLVFLVRHAEKAASAPAPAGTATRMTAASDDPPLSAPGRERAAKLASMLRSADIRHVFSTEFQRTRQTAAPTALARHLEVVAIPAKDPDALLAQVRQTKDNVLIVGHSNTIPDLLSRLGITAEIAIADAEYDNLFIVVRPESGAATLIRLRF